MAGSFGGSIKLTGESEYTRALKTITSNLTVMASEMKLVSSQFGSTDKSVQAVTSRNQVLNKQRMLHYDMKLIGMLMLKEFLP